MDSSMMRDVDIAFSKKEEKYKSRKNSILYIDFMLFRYYNDDKLT